MVVWPKTGTGNDQGIYKIKGLWQQKIYFDTAKEFWMAHETLSKRVMNLG
jgi:hypothetical protein